MPRNRTRLLSAVLAILASGLASAPVIAADAADEQESPALRKPLPSLAVPTDDPTQEPVFSTEAPPPPPFDPNYQPPTHVQSGEKP
jgi:hypothetical protein